MPDTTLRTRRRTSLIAPLLTLAAVALALWPYAEVIQLLSWAVPSVIAAILIVATGLLGRWILARQRLGVSIPVTVAAQGLVFALLLTWRFAPHNSALFGVIPTRRSLAVVPYYLDQATSEVWYGTAPLVPSVSVTFAITIIFGVFAIVLDHLVALRRAMAASVAVVIVAAMPAVATRDPVDLRWFVVYALLVLVLLRRSVGRGRETPRRSPLVAAAGVGVVAIAATLFLAPSLPVSASGFGPTRTVVLGASLDLGEDLRSPGRHDVITLATGTSRAPYLRIATLSDFTGDTWVSDVSDTQPLADGFTPIATPRAQERVSTSIRVQDVSGRWLPVPYPAIAARGLSDEWELMPENRTIVTATDDVRDQDYTITSFAVQPTLDEVRSDRAAGAGSTYLQLPEAVPASIEQLAREVTADRTNDYDRLTALQSWFRSQFRYSLQTPVNEGFDGSGAEAVSIFLERRSGYCIHFASAFALMARTLDMPARIVVGFLPGEPTGEMRGEESLFTVTSDKLHAWPEVHFAEWGWVPFEPTASLGFPTQFFTTAQPAVGATRDAAASSSEVAPTEEAVGPETDQFAGTTGTTVPGGLPPFDPRPFVIGAVALLMVLTVPFIARTVQRHRRIALAASGDAAAAWAELCDSLIDQRADASTAESPRSRGRRLITGFGADASDVAQLITAVEQASYARRSDALELAGPLRRVLRQVRAHARASDRFLAAVFPRSLLQGAWSRVPLPAQA